MPIHRTYGCGDCGHFLEVTLAMEDWDAPPPECPQCTGLPLTQHFKPIAINGSAYARARTIAEDIAAKDYNVADLTWRKNNEDAPRTPHRLKDETPQTLSAATGSQWGVTGEALQAAVSAGRQIRLNHGGSGLDVLHGMLKDGTQPDLIEASKRRAMKVW